MQPFRVEVGCIISKLRLGKQSCSTRMVKSASVHFLALAATLDYPKRHHMAAIMKSVAVIITDRVAVKPSQNQPGLQIPAINPFPGYLNECVSVSAHI